VGWLVWLVMVEVFWLVDWGRQLVFLFQRKILVVIFL